MASNKNERSVSMYQYCKNKLNNNEGFTLVEVSLVMVILLILMLSALPNILKQSGEVHLSKLLHETTTLTSVSKMYYDENKEWPIVGEVLDKKTIASPVLNKIIEKDSTVMFYPLDERKIADSLAPNNTGVDGYALITSKGKHDGLVVFVEGIKDNKGIIYHSQRIFGE